MTGDDFDPDELLNEALEQLSEDQLDELAIYVSAGLARVMALDDAAATAEAYDNLMRGLSRPH